jgi:putative flippase GtrA
MVGRALRYGVAGLAATMLYFCAVAALVEVAVVGPVAAAAAATGLVIVSSYVVNRTWVFDARRTHGAAVWRFLVASAFSMVLNAGLMYLSVQVLRWWYVAGLLLTTAVVPPTNFVINYVWCFQSAASRPSWPFRHRSRHAAISGLRKRTDSNCRHGEK